MNQVDLVPLWKALADAKRRRIIRLLQEQALTTSEISTHFDVSRFAIMRHLKVLEQAELIKTRREGRQRWNFINEGLFHQIRQKYMDDGGDGEFQLGDVLTFLTRQEGDRPRESVTRDHPPIELEASIKATPDLVFQAFTNDIDNWWSYRIVADSHMYLEPRVGGRFYEKFDRGGGALYALVTFIKPREELRLSGTMGLFDEAADNSIHLVLQPGEADSTRLTLTHRFVNVASALTVETFKRSWYELITQHLTTYVESGVGYQERFDWATNMKADS